MRSGVNKVWSLAAMINTMVPESEISGPVKPETFVDACGMNGQLVQRCVIVTKDECGYGLTVSGDNPVFVQSVKEDGAAARAGVQVGDRIIKVNGTLVTGANHMEVVKLITGGSYCALSLLGKPPEPGVQPSLNSRSSQSFSCGPASPPPVLSLTDAFSRSSARSPTVLSSQNPLRSPPPLTAGTKLISGPVQLNEEKQVEWRKKRIQIIYHMLDEERKHLEELYKELQQNPNEKTQQAIEKGQRQVKNLEVQLADFSARQSENLGVAPHGPNRTESFGGQSIAKRSGSFINVAADSDPRTLHHSETVPAFGMERPPVEGQIAGLHFVAPGQIDVTPMEDEDSDSEYVQPLDTHGPFSNFLELKTRPAHLAVFMNYLVSNSDPSSLLFYLVTDQFKSGSCKELRRWAYEIFSSFLTPTAPSRIGAADSEIVAEIDSVLNNPAAWEQEDTLKKLFVRSRQKALDEISDQLKDFRDKRTLGLGSVFDENLLTDLRPGDKSGELKVMEALLFRHFDNFLAGVSDFESLPEKTQVLLSALATVVRSMGVKPSQNAHERLLDRCPHFVLKSKIKLLAKVQSKKTAQVKGHQLTLVPVYSATVCYQCREPIWGINAQAYQCSNCDVVLHRACTGLLEDACYPAGQKRPGGVRPQPLKKVVPRAAPIIIKETTAIREEPESRSDGEERDQVGDMTGSPKNKDAFSRSTDSGYGDGVKASSTTTNTGIARSQSMRNRSEMDRMRKQKLPRTGIGVGLESPRSMSDVDADDKSIAIAMQPMSNSSSGNISARSGSLLDSPTHSQEGLRPASLDLPQLSPATLDYIAHGSTGMLEGYLQTWKQAAKLDFSATDSDLEADTECPKIEELIEPETLKHMKPKERKRQEVINELFHTERTHVRNLKVLYKVFYNPMLTNQILKPHEVKLLFANIEEILELHIKINEAMKKWPREHNVFGEVGDLLLNLFDGEPGEHLKLAASNFCQHQQFALETLRTTLKRDQKLSQFLSEAELNASCRKLQLKDMLPIEMQRVVKYPLLFENLAKYTPEETAEVEKIRRCSDLSKRIVDSVNSAKTNSENVRRLEDLQKRLDTSAFDKVHVPLAQEFRGLDLKKYRLIHDGQLVWRLGKNKAVDLHVILLSELLVLLTRTNENRLVLRFHSVNAVASGKEEAKYTHCPVLRLTDLLPKPVANDKKAFFLINQSKVGPQIYELVAQTSSERKTWFQRISEQVELCMPKRQQQPLDKAEQEGTVPASGLAPEPSTESSDASQGEEDIERVQVTSQPRLIQPAEVRVCKPTIFQHAEPVISNLEKLKRRDDSILRALREKNAILAEMCNISSIQELDNIAELAGELKGNKEAKELVLAAVVHTNRLLEAINESLRAARDEAATCEGEAAKVAVAAMPSVPSTRLTYIAAPLMKCLTQLLHAVEQNEDDLTRVRRELHHLKEKEFSTGVDASRCRSHAEEQSPRRNAPTTDVDEFVVNAPPVVNVAPYGHDVPVNRQVSDTNRLGTLSPPPRPSSSMKASDNTSSDTQSKASARKDSSVSPQRKIVHDTATSLSKSSNSGHQATVASAPSAAPRLEKNSSTEEPDDKKDKMRQKRRRNTGLSGPDGPTTPPGNGEPVDSTTAVQ